MTIEEFNKELINKVIEDFEQITNSVTKKIDTIRNRMCANNQDFIKGFEEEYNNVFILAEYRVLLSAITSTIRNYSEDDYNVLNLLKELKQETINEYIKLNVRFNTTSVMYNLRKLSKVEAYQKLIYIINMQINKYTKLYKSAQKLQKKL